MICPILACRAPRLPVPCSHLKPVIGCKVRNPEESVALTCWTVRGLQAREERSFLLSKLLLVGCELFQKDKPYSLISEQALVSTIRNWFLSYSRERTIQPCSVLQLSKSAALTAALCSNGHACSTLRLAGHRSGFLWAAAFRAPEVEEIVL